MIRERSVNPKPIMPKFIFDSMNDLVKDEDETKFISDKIHTLTCKEQNNKIAPTISRHLERYDGMKQRPMDDHGQNCFAQ